MNFRNVLWTYKPRQDGSCDIKLYCNYLGKKKYFTTGLKVKPGEWDSKKGVVKKNHPLAMRYNAKINKLRLDIERHFLDGGHWGNLFEKDGSPSLISFLETIIAEARQGLLPLQLGTIKNYNSSLTRLKQYKEYVGADPSLDGVDIHFYGGFTSFLSEHHNCGLPGINKHVKILKRVLNIGLERGLHNNRAHQEKGFRRHRVTDAVKIYLNESDVTALENADFSGQLHLQRELDRWLTAYYFLMRFSDVVNINKECLHFIENSWFLKYNSVKTGIGCTIPIRARAMKLLERHNFDFSWGSNPQANRNIKTAVSIAGLNYMTEEGDVRAPKASLVTMHTARRSAATNMYLSGEFSIKTIADLGGWKSIKVLQSYLKCSSMDSARLAAKSEYFR